jgi:hypothetical protein
VFKVGYKTKSYNVRLTGRNKISTQEQKCLDFIKICTYFSLADITDMTVRAQKMQTIQWVGIGARMEQV